MSAQLSAVLPLSGWENFYVIVGSSAAALTGLTFIVITISSDRSQDSAARRVAGLRAFISPTVVHFTGSLWISAVLNVPGHTALSLSLCLAVASVAGLVYCGRTLYWMLRTFTDSLYTPFLEDWIWNAALPVLAYLGLLGCAWGLLAHPGPSLYVVAAIALLLLFIGIHNAWDVVAWLTTERHERKNRERRPAEPPRRDTQL